MRTAIPPLEFGFGPDDMPAVEIRSCDHPGCAGFGEYRAPRSRERLNDYYWFCLDHVREYNRSWNFCAGLSDGEVEALIRHDTCWNRPTWPLGATRAREETLRHRARRFFTDEAGFGAGGWRPGAEPASAPRSAEDHALLVFELRRPVDLAMIKARYKVLVKLHHPDANGGSREAEEKLKTINQAYSTLKACYGL